MQTNSMRNGASAVRRESWLCCLLSSKLDVAHQPHPLQPSNRATSRFMKHERESRGSKERESVSYKMHCAASTAKHPCQPLRVLPLDSSKTRTDTTLYPYSTSICTSVHLYICIPRLVCAISGSRRPGKMAHVANRVQRAMYFCILYSVFLSVFMIYDL